MDGQKPAAAFSGFLSRLSKDVAGNVLAIAAASVLPLLAAVGGAIDVSRYYMATARLQNACDSGALAARKIMGDDDWTTSDRDHGLTFFDQNYPEGTFGLENLTRNFSATDGVVTGTASGNLPTTLMDIFGFGALSISVTCSAEINISNTDIMFVLDVTGSMNCPDDGSYCPGSNNNNVEASNAKIKGLRTAVLSFYDAVDAATSSDAQVRFGIVPYASNVNVGASIPSQYMASAHTYQSREPQWDVSTSWEITGYTINSVYDRTREYRNGTDWGGWSYTGAGASACEAGMPSGQSDTYIEDTIDPNSVEINSQSTSGNTRTSEITAEGQFYRGVPTYQYWWGYCRVGIERYDYNATFDFTLVEEYTTTKEFDSWTYKPVEYDLTDLYTNGSMTTPTGNQGADVTHTWTGCIEEAKTINSAPASFSPSVPQNAYDLDINLIPSNDDERWKPQLPLAVYKRETGSGWGGQNFYGPLNNTTAEMANPSYDCPKSAFRLSEVSRSYLEDYLSASNGFDARSNTYHDIGMIWGARFISPNGIFSSDNATAPNGDSISRHIVYMTDGVLSVNREIYNTYGIEWWDRRISDNTQTSAIEARHAARFQAACRAARAENISVWVVAFGTSLSQNLIDCATPGRAYQAGDSEDLEDAFEEIAQKIAELRLTE